MHTIGFLVQMSKGLNPSSSHAGSYPPSFLRTLKELKSIGSFNINWLLNIRLAFTWEWISFSNCLALLLVIRPLISSGVSFEDEWMLGMSSSPCYTCLETHILLLVPNLPQSASWETRKSSPSKLSHHINNNHPEAIIQSKQTYN